MYEICGSPRDPYMILCKFLSKLPPNRSCASLYLQPKANCNEDDPYWYHDRPIGVNRLQKVVSTMCSQAGLPGYYTNHSLYSTAATRLYHNKFEEQVIQEITGHRSLAVRSYKRTCDDQLKYASDCIFAQNNFYSQLSQSCVQESPL